MANKITGTYRNGSSGDEVRQIQQKLIDAGYDVGKSGADGVFGENTLAAVQQYQKANGLAVDGIVGKNTLASLFGSNTGTETTKPTQEAPAQTATPATTPATTPAATATPTEPAAPVTSPAGFTYGDFSYAAWNPQDDPTIQQANALLQQHMSNPVGEYKPVWQDEADAYLSQYQNRDPFSYDFNSDALYNQYKDQYIQQGKMAMMDTMGQAAALTGGYGNSYAQTVGQQAYNQQLNQLNEIMPELYGMAYDRYNKEGQDLLDMYGMYMDREALAYSQHQDSLNNWYKQLDYLTDNYNTAYDRGYDNYLLGYENAWNEYSTDRAEEFEKYQNAINQEFTASENEKDRAHQAAENEKSRNFTAEQNKIDRQTSQKTGSDKGKTGSTGESGVELDHVSAMSSSELVGYLQSYQKRSDDTGLAAFLDDCVATGRLTETQADNYYAQYKTKKKEKPIATDVPPTSKNNVSDSGNRFGVKMYTK